MELRENSRAKSFIKTPKLNVILCVFANDGTALETGHWVRFSVKGKHQSKNSSRYSTRLNPSPSPKYLKDKSQKQSLHPWHLWTTFVPCVWPLITPRIEVKLPVKLWQTFSENTSKLYNRANHIISYPGTSYTSFCEVYYKSTRVCDDWKLLGKVSYLPSLCFCDTCRDCFRRVPRTVCSDCESDNKNAFETHIFVGFTGLSTRW